ncbi:MAG: asparagine synthetase B, partial [Acidobacteria bacterium]
MCGIAGVYEYATGRPVETQALLDMLSVIRHRGPDDEGTYVHNNFAMGMRRLSIIDLAGGKQPISNEDGSVTVVFNGEIYNYRELREKLRARGHKLVTASDTEVIVHLYEELGQDCVRELRGMFGFALWDAARQRLFIARDRLGIKPLYYLEHRGCLIFASEIKAILQHPHVTADVNMDALSQFISLKYVPAPQTMFAGIRCVPPG